MFIIRQTEMSGKQYDQRLYPSALPWLRSMLARVGPYGHLMPADDSDYGIVIFSKKPQFGRVSP
jgi:hypothetical protein